MPKVIEATLNIGWSLDTTFGSFTAFSVSFVSTAREAVDFDDFNQDCCLTGAWGDDLFRIIPEEALLALVRFFPVRKAFGNDTRNEKRNRR